MGWTLRLLRHRAAAQRTIVAAVLAVALTGATLLGTFALLLFTTEHRALDTTLDRAPATATDIDVLLSISGVSPADTAAAGHAYLDQLLGDVPATRTTWLTSPMYRLLGEAGPSRPLGYLAAYPDVPSHATLLAGRWPTRATDGSGRVAVSVPGVAAERYGWEVGDELPVENLDTSATSAVVVVGIHELTGPRSDWARDLLLGAEYAPQFLVPHSFTFTEAWGPFVVAPDALTATGSVGMVDLAASPRLAGSPPGAIGGLRDRLDDAQATVLAATGGLTVSSHVTSRLAPTIDATLTDLAVTRVSLVIVGLMLVVLTVTVLVLAARLLAERRAPEQALMSSRGASDRQLLGLATLEAAAVALLTTLVSPWLAVLLFRALTSTGPLTRAGLRHDPGRPASLWITCAVAAFVLAAVLLGPLLRRRSSAVDAERRLVRQDRHGGLLRSGADVALLGLAGVALWQLSLYETPVGRADVTRLDPVLVAAPTMLLVAGAVLALRLLPLVARLGERMASRSTALVSPLAAWEVGRRPSRAAGGVLLLTLAVAVGSFSQVFLDTWRTSQQEQVDLAVGTDVRLVGMTGSAPEQADVVASLPGVESVSPVIDRAVTLGRTALGVTPDSASRANLLALDTTQADALLRGRIVPSWGTITAPLAPPEAEADGGIALPGAPTHLRLDVESVPVPHAHGTLRLWVVVEDRHGSLSPLPVETLDLATSMQDIDVALPASSPGGLELVGIVGHALYADRGSDASALDVRVHDLRAVEGETVTAVALDGPAWTAQSRADAFGGRTPVSAAVDAGVLRVTGLLDPAAILDDRAGFAATTFGPVGPVPVVATDTLVAALSVEVDAQLELDLGATVVPITIVREVPYLPGLPRGAGLLADRAVLSRAALQTSWPNALLDGWWLEVPDALAPDLVEHVREADLGVAVARADARDAAIDGPLPIGVQAALWIVTFAAVALAVAGMAMSVTVGVRTRRLELARLQALGVARSGLVRSVLVEHGIVGGIGLLAGLTLGAALGLVVAPSVTVAAGGGRPVPAVVVQWPWSTEVGFVAVLVVLVGAVVAVTASSLLRRASGELLRLGDER